MVHAISSAAAAQPQVWHIEKCLVRESGVSLFVELHVEVDPAVTILEGHRVKAALIKSNKHIQDVTFELLA